MVIDGAALLKAVATSGDGTAASPYLLESLHIDARGAPFCLIVRNVSAHFVVRECQFEGATEAALVLENVRNGWFVDNTFARNRCAVAVADATGPVVFVGNAFLENDYDASLGATSTVDWSDGYMGNCWDRASGDDNDRDGIYDSPYVLRLQPPQVKAALDHLPLTKPIVGTNLEPGTALLHVSYEKHAIVDMAVTFEARLTSTLLSLRFLTETAGTQLLRHRVLTAPGTGTFTIEQVVVQDSGRTTINGVPETYESSEGERTIRKLHRLGILTIPGYGLPDLEFTQIEPARDLPAIPVPVGYTWGDTRSVPVEAPGVKSGEQTTTRAFRLDSIQLVGGQLCAVIHGELTAVARATGVNVLLGGLPYETRQKLVLRSTMLFSLSRRRVVHQQVEVTIKLSLSSDGVVLQSLSGHFSATAQEVPPGAREDARLTPGRPPDQLALLLELYAAGDYPRAVVLGKELAALLETAGELEWAAVAWSVAGSALMAQGDYRAAVELLERAQELLHQIRRPREEASVWNDLGVCYRRLGEHSTALQCYERVLILAGGDTELRSTALLNSGSCLLAMGRYVNALERFYEARELRRGQDVPGEINVLNFIGICYRKLGLYDAALRTYDEALALCAGDTQPFLRVIVTSNKANALLEMGNAKAALSLLLWVREQWALLQNPDGEAAAWVKIALCQRQLGRPDVALAGLERAQRLSKRDDIVASAQYVVGLCYLDIGAPERALQHLLDAREWVQEGGDYEGLWRCDWALAKSYWSLGDLAAARRSFESAIAAVETARSQFEEETRRTYMGSSQALYRDYLDFLWETAEKGVLLWHAEWARARSFLEALALGGTASLVRSGSSDLPQGVGGVLPVEELQKLVIAAGSCLKRNEAVIAYALGEDRLFYWVLTVPLDGTPQILGPGTREISYDELFWRVYRLRSLIEGPPGESPVERAVRIAALQDKLQELYQLLVEPIEPAIADKDTLIIVPAGPLWYVPFAALRDRNGTNLVERYALGYAPSVASITLILVETSDTTQLRALGFANPDRKDMPALTRMEGAMQTLVDAAGGGRVYVGPQATESAVFEELGIRAERSRKPSEDKTITPVGGYTYVAFGCHGVFNHVNPLYSFLALGKHGERDGNLFAVEAFDLDLRGTRFALLLACETFLPAVESRMRALGTGQGSQMTAEEAVRSMRELAQGDELLGLTRTLLLVGAEAVLATHWEVSEPVAQQFAMELSARLNTGITRARVLQGAQLSILRRHPDPWFWAPFIIVGNWR